MTTTYVDRRTSALDELDSTPNDGALKRTGTRNLSRLCETLGVTHVQRGKTSVLLADAYPKVTNDERVALLRAEQRKPRAAQPDATAFIPVTDAEAALFPDDKELLVNAERTGAYCYEEIKRLTVEQFNTVTREWNPPDYLLGALASQLAVRVGTLMTRDRSGQLADTSKLTFRRDVFKAINAHVEQDARQWYAENLRLNVETVAKTVAYAMSHIADAKKAGDVKRLNERKEDVFTLDPTEMLCRVAAVLQLLDDDTPPAQWKEVSFALAVATGRRMSEIHHSATFTLHGDHALHFTGQAKTKGDTAHKTDDGFVIPTLVDAENCVKALRWLTKNGKRVEDAKTVNTRYSKALSDHAKTFYKTAPAMLADDEARKAVDPDAKTRCTYHRLRQIYGLCAIRSYRPANMQDVRYLGDILGHNQDASVSDRYTADLRIAEGARTHI